MRQPIRQPGFYRALFLIKYYSGEGDLDTVVYYDGDKYFACGDSKGKKMSFFEWIDINPIVFEPYVLVEHN